MKRNGLRKLMGRLHRGPLPLPYFTPPTPGAVRFSTDLRTAAQLVGDGGQ